jgi:hypothetical protein
MGEAAEILRLLALGPDNPNHISTVPINTAIQYGTM